MRVGSLCSGIGGAERALESVWPDAHPVWFAEVDKDAATVFSHHWPGIPNLGDLTAVSWEVVAQEAPIDVLTAGFPRTMPTVLDRRSTKRSQR